MAAPLQIPVTFDLDGAIPKAQSDIDRVLKAMNKTIENTPLVANVQVSADDRSVKSIEKRLKDLQKEFDNLSESARIGNRMTGEFTPYAKELLNQIARLKAARSTYAQSSKDIVKNSSKAVEDEFKADKRRLDQWLRDKDKEAQAAERAESRKTASVERETGRRVAALQREKELNMGGSYKGYTSDTNMKAQLNGIEQLRRKYEEARNELNRLLAQRATIKINIDRSFDAEVARINGEIAKLRQLNLTMGAKGDVAGIKANLNAIRAWEGELQRISQQKISLFNADATQQALSQTIDRTKSLTASMYTTLTEAERKYATDGAMNTALDAHSRKVTEMRLNVEKLEQQLARLQATGKMTDAYGSYTREANTLLAQRAALLRQIETATLSADQAAQRSVQQRDLTNAGLQAEQRIRAAKRESEEASRRELELLNQQLRQEERLSDRKAAQARLNDKITAQWQQQVAALRQLADALNKAAFQKWLKSGEKSIDDITRKLQYWRGEMNKSSFGSDAFKKAADEVKRLSALLRRAQEQINSMTGSADKHAAAQRQVTGAVREQHSWLRRMVQRMAAYWSVQQVISFLTKIREVTAQFELQRISLGAIIQDQTRANALFAEIKSFALKSPVKIMDLTKYTKQLAAYKIGVDDLFETTKRLTDISVGLGVSMDRIVLLYGQVRATGYLRASEVRQATEAGIPIVEELAKKLTKMRGELVSAADVMQMISERQISFDLVKQVFEDMTSAGGAFYNMQEKQGNTLFGMWAKLGDAASVMYDEMGNTGLVNAGMKNLIQLLTDLMRNWKAVGAAMAVAVGIPGSVAAVRGIKRWAESLRETALNKATLATQRRAAAEERLNYITAHGTAADKARAAAALNTARAQETAALKASQAVQSASTATLAFKAIGSAVGWMAIITAITALVGWLTKLYQDATRLKNKLDEIKAETPVLADQSVRNFERLAQTAVTAVNGSKAQKEALEELDRSYSQILGKETVQLENLRALKGHYEGVAVAIRNYIDVQQKQKQISAIQEEYGAKIAEVNKKAYQKLVTEEMALQVDGFYYKLKLTETEFALFWQRLAEEAEKTGKVTEETIAKVLKELNIIQLKSTKKALGTNDYVTIGVEDITEAFARNSLFNALIGSDLQDAAKAIYNMKTETDRLAKSWDASSKNLGAYTAWAAELKSFNDEQRQFNTDQMTFNKDDAQWHDKRLKYLEDAKGKEKELAAEREKIKEKEQGYRMSDGSQITDTSSFAYQQAQTNSQVLAVQAQLREALNKELGLTADEVNKGYFNIVQAVNPDDLVNISEVAWDKLIEYLQDKGKPELLAYVQFLKEQYQAMSPDPFVVKTWRTRWQEIAKGMEISKDAMQRYMMQSGDDFETYRKKIKGEVEKIVANIAIMQKALQMRKTQREKEDYSGPFGKIGKIYDDWEYAKEEKELKEAEKNLKALRKLYKELESVNTDPDKKKEGGSKGGSKGGSTQDKRMELLKNEFAMVKKLYEEYGKLSKTLGNEDAAAKLRENYAETLAMLEKRHGITLPTDINAAAAALDKIVAKMGALRGLKNKKGKSLFPNAQKEFEDYRMQVENLRVDALGKALETKLKELSDRIARTKTAREFYDKVLEQTGDLELAASVSLSLYGSTGQELKAMAAEQIREYFKDVYGNYAVEIPVEVIGADDGVNYLKLRELAESAYKAEKIGKKAYEALLKIADAGQKDLAKTYEGYLKDLEKAKTFADKRIELARDTANKIAEINADKSLSEKEKARLREGYMERERRMAAEQEYDAFKNSALYVQMFENLDYASSGALKRMRERLEGLKSEWQNLGPTELKELQSRLNEIEAQLADRNPFGALGKAYGDMFRMLRQGRTRSGDEKAAADAAAAWKSAYEKMLADERAYEAAKAQSGAESEAAKGARKTADASKEAYKSAEKTANETAEAAAAWKRIGDLIAKANEKIDKYQETFNGLADDAKAIMEDFGADEVDLQFLDDLKQGINDAVDGVQQLGTGMASFMAGDIFGGLTGAVGGIAKLTKGIANLFTAGKVRKANKEIARQEKLIKQLEYSYGRLQAAADKLFGGEYLNNYNDQIKSLRALQAAYAKQAEAEASKGKKKDKDKYEEYLEQARDTADKIKELQDDLVSHFTGKSHTDAAKEFAESWLEAKAAFASTTDAMKSKYRDLVKTMIIEGAAAKVVDALLQPLWQQMQTMLSSGDMYGAMDFLVNAMDEFIGKGESALNVLWNTLEARGYDLKEIFGDSSSATGIAKDVSAATSEEVNANTAALNTQNFYMDKIAAEVTAMRALMERDMSLGSGTTLSEMRDMLASASGHLATLPNIEANTAAAVAELQQLAASLNRVVRPKGDSGSYGVNVYLRN